MVITYSIHASVEHVKKQIHDIDEKKIPKVENDIRKVENDIQKVEKKLEKGASEREKEQLLIDKKDLRWKERQLWTKERLLRREKEQLRELLLKELPPLGMYHLNNIPGILRNYISGITR